MRYWRHNAVRCWSGFAEIYFPGRFFHRRPWHLGWDFDGLAWLDVKPKGRCDNVRLTSCWVGSMLRSKSYIHLISPAFLGVSPVRARSRASSTIKPFSGSSPLCSDGETKFSRTLSSCKKENERSPKYSWVLWMQDPVGMIAPLWLQSRGKDCEEVQLARRR